MTKRESKPGSKYCKIKDVCHIIGGNPAPKGDNAFSRDGIPFVRMKDLGRYHLTTDLNEVSDRVNPEYELYKRMKLIKKGSILLPRSGSVALNHRAILGQDSYIVSHICALEVKATELLNKYLYYFLCRIDMRCIFKKTTGLDAITFEDLGKISIPIPPITEQKRIVEILEKADTLRKKRQEADELSNKLIQSIFLEMFGDLNINPKKWAISSLEKICLSKGQYGSGAAATKYDSNKPRYIRITDIDSSGYLSSEKVSPSTSKDEWKDCVLESGDIIFARSGATVGKTYLYREEDGFCVYAGYLIRFKPNTKLVHPDYLYAFTKTNFYKKWVESKMRTAAQPNINAKQYGHELLIPLPPLSQQQKFAELVQKVEKIKEKQRESKKELDNLFDSLMGRLFN